MKINTSVLAAALGLASVSLANATNYVHMTGSTAARDAVYNTLISGVGFDAVPTFAGMGNSTPGNCSYMIFSNTVSGTPTIVKCTWSGSEAGLADVNSTTVEPFLSDSLLATPGANSSSPSSSVQTNDLTTVDLCQADNALAFSKQVNPTSSQFFDNLAIPFVFVKSTNEITDSTAFTTVTSDNFKNLAQGGDLLAVFTGGAADINNYVYLAGRDDNSGTRANTFGVTGWGIKKAPKQIEMSASAGVGSMIKVGTSYYTAQGQSSGGTLAKSFGDTTSSVDQINGGTGFIAVAYLGLSDDATAEGAPYNAIRLNYNGVPYTVANVENGLYTLWGKEYTMTRSGVSSQGAALASALVANLLNHTTGFEISYSLMNVDRTGPTAYPVHN